MVKTFLTIIAGLVIIAGVYIAINQTKSGAIVEEKDGNSILRSITWFLPKGTSSSSQKDTKNQQVNFLETKIENQKEEQKKEEEIIPPSGFQKKDLSPFYKKVRITRITPANPSNYSSPNGFQLQAESSNKEAIFITGWKLAGNGKTEVYVPRAIGDYLPSGIPSEDAIALSPGGYAIFYSTRSPLGKNLRLNMCTGYLNHSFSFSPSLPNECPLPYNREEVVSSSGECQSFLFSLSRCAIVSPNNRNRFYGSIDSTCRAVLDRFTYGYCYDHNRTKPGFFLREWRVWLGIPMPFDKKHDRVILYDNAGLVVNEYSY